MVSAAHRPWRAQPHCRGVDLFRFNTEEYPVPRPAPIIGGISTVVLLADQRQFALS